MIARLRRRGEEFKTYQKRGALINAFEPELELESDAELRERMDALRERAAEGESLDELLPECFVIVRRPASARWPCATSTRS